MKKLVMVSVLLMALVLCLSPAETASLRYKDMHFRDVLSPRCPITPPNPHPVFPPYNEDDLQACWEGCRMRPHACPLRGVRLDYEWTGNGWDLTCVCLRDCDFMKPHVEQLQMT